MALRWTGSLSSAWPRLRPQTARIDSSNPCKSECRRRETKGGWVIQCQAAINRMEEVFNTKKLRKEFRCKNWKNEKSTLSNFLTNWFLLLLLRHDSLSFYCTILRVTSYNFFFFFKKKETCCKSLDALPVYSVFWCLNAFLIFSTHCVASKRLIWCNSTQTRKSHFPHHQLKTVKGSLGNNLHQCLLVPYIYKYRVHFYTWAAGRAPWQPTNAHPNTQKEIRSGSNLKWKTTTQSCWFMCIYCTFFLFL